MARTEARIYVDIWKDENFLARSVEAQRMFMFLISQPDLAHDGVIVLRERLWARKAGGQTVEDVHKALDELSATGYVVIDEDTQELLVRSFIRRDKVYRQPNVLRSAADHLPLIESPFIKFRLWVEVERIIAEGGYADTSADLLAEMAAYLKKGFQNPSENPPTDDVPIPPESPTPGLPGERGVVTVVPPGFPVPLSSVPLTPSSVAAASLADDGEPKPKQRRATRIPDDFKVTPEMVAWAGEKAPNVNGKTETEKFINYWRAKSGKDATKLDWPATWRNWMLTAQERAPSQQGGNRLRGQDTRADSAKYDDPNMMRFK